MDDSVAITVNVTPEVRDRLRDAARERAIGSGILAGFLVREGLDRLRPVNQLQMTWTEAPAEPAIATLDIGSIPAGHVDTVLVIEEEETDV